MSASQRDLAAPDADDTRQVDRTAEAPVASSDPGLVSPRGSTTIAPGALAAIARHAASEVDGVEGVGATGLQGRLASLRSTTSGGASADVAAGRAAIDLRLAVRWPMPVHEVTIAVREHVRRRVTELTGHAVTDVDIVVAELPAAARLDRPRVR